ncbi:benzoate membrane transport protein [Halopolyspora algeriensis]|uniref:Benzoate membrane transport protein n=1 Tax=Halopolyspora algeriensis TaxID=1500506 RepID=A0A368VYR6_9ACTN|nr:benzoate/H(+) symporter BenE family transporter [Halopolyspora algeriensis]RCW45972.1 benzoate membrane transport protein [Halopolyspora algeriensis]TQM55385.1 benzoate membrane transport protein [Halopolyspora algeriensis]
MTIEQTERTDSGNRLFEPPVRPFPTVRRMARDFGALYAANGLIGLIFAATGPVAVILAVGKQGGLSQAQLASWIFGVFLLNGILTVLACWAYRQPLSFFWTIPGTVLVGPALDHLAWPEVVGAFLATGVLILVLGLSGWVGRVMEAIPMPIVMGMVAGVFLSFGLDLVHALVGDIAIAGPMVLLFLLLSRRSSLGRWIPPIIGALLVGGIAVALSGRFAPDPAATQWIATPMLQAPQWSWQAMLELVVPLAITVLVVQNGQGVAVLRSAGHTAPVNTVAIACGAWSMLTSFVGSVSTCLTGPTNALLTASGQRSRHYIAGISCGVLAIVFGLFAPLFTDLMLATPGAFIATLGGLAMLRVLQSSFVTAFNGRFTFGALITFVVTVADVEILNIGSAFWGLLAGLTVSWLLERSDFTTLDEERA